MIVFSYANGNFAEALELYTQAINETACKDDLSMLYSNRSATYPLLLYYFNCLTILITPMINFNDMKRYYCLGNYEQALSDANKAIELSPTWGKGYARKGISIYVLQ